MLKTWFLHTYRNQFFYIFINLLRFKQNKQNPGYLFEKKNFSLKYSTLTELDLIKVFSLPFKKPGFSKQDRFV